MGKATGFKEFGRHTPKRIPVADRLNNYSEIYLDWDESEARNQGSRCMNCSVPFCMSGCPLGNLIPDFNDLVYKGDWKAALEELHTTNNFPEFTGRICPAPCEESCVLNINQDPVTIEHIEKNIADMGWDKGWIKPNPPKYRTGKKIAIIGSGPSGLASAQQLNRAGHTVTVYERAEDIGGLLRFGIPDFKLDKNVLERRILQMKNEGINFLTNANVGKDIPIDGITTTHDAILLTGGCTVPRNLDIPGRDLQGVHFAMEFLTQQNKRKAGIDISASKEISAKNKNVVILGGGDTGSDCLGTSHRQGATNVFQYELLPEPPSTRRDEDLWPNWPLLLRTSSSHEEGGERDYNILTKGFTGTNGKVEELHGVRLEWGEPDSSGRPAMKEIANSEFTIKADLILLAMGFIHPERGQMIEDLDIELDQRGNVKTDNRKMTTREGVFAAGDMGRGQSLVVWALAEGREAAREIDKYLMGSTTLPKSASTY